MRPQTIEDEIRGYPWRNARWHPDKLEASSPARPGDDRPSFRVITDPDSPHFGCWVDMGATDPRYRRGGPVQLLAMLRGISEDEARRILAEEKGDGPADYITLHLREPTAKSRPKPLDITPLDRYSTQTSDYLTNRGISPDVQALFRTGYDPQSRAITIPWLDAAGRLMTVKYRTTYAKRFWYAKDGVPVRDLIYGIDVIYAQGIRKVAIVEAELDALVLWTMGMPAIATGGAAFNEKKRDLILRSPIEEIVLVRDNDAAGRQWRNEIVAALSGRLALSVALVPRGYKDVGEWGPSDIRRMRRINQPSLNLSIAV
ncbi:toprim domain-containing protein [uncultured Paenibacillus sp.]|uniref:toprim domain-containing protein n=1 Tax=uncultured Paenibacillus sp. TaxID=227322 RepID=UPI0015ADF086|nr:toprim domain-containing protein [uncultured Paenibacillus sp.]